MRMNRFALGGAVGAAAVMAATSSGAQDEAAASRGNAVFQHTCAPCHAAGPGEDGAPMLPGTHALELKYRGGKPPLLEARSDLPAAVIKAFVRNGVASMPPFRPTEVSDADIGDIAAYLAQSAKAASPSTAGR
jgi:mono/diheme cytochrome c family protein